MIDLKEWLEYKLAPVENKNFLKEQILEWIKEHAQFTAFQKWKEGTEAELKTGKTYTREEFRKHLALVDKQREWLKGTFVEDYEGYVITTSDRAKVGDFIKFKKYVYEIEAIASVEGFTHLCFVDEEDEKTSFTEGVLGITILQHKQ